VLVNVGRGPLVDEKALYAAPAISPSRSAA